MKAWRWGVGLVGMLAAVGGASCRSSSEPDGEPGAQGGSGSGGGGVTTSPPACVPGEPAGQAPAPSEADRAWLTPEGERAVLPPPAADGEKAGDGESVLALSEIFLGDTRRDGTSDPEAWRQYGLDLDGWSSTPAQAYHCQAVQCSEPRYIRQDGERGIDNSFGPNVGGILATLTTRPSEALTAPLIGGLQTMLIDLAGIGPAASYASLTGGLSTARGEVVEGATQAPPAGDWSGYAWHPVEGTRAPFAQAYLVDDVLVATFAEPVTLGLVLFGQPWSVRVHAARLTLDLRDRARGVDGTIAGIVWPEELVEASHPVGRRLSSQLCQADSSLGRGIDDALRKASDILVDGTQDPTRECDGISLGLGFSARAATRGASVGPTGWPDPCAP